MSSMNAVAVDASGNAYVTGYTFASDYPRTPGLPASAVSPGFGAVATAFFAPEDFRGGGQIPYAGALLRDSARLRRGQQLLLEHAVQLGGRDCGGLLR